MLEGAISMTIYLYKKTHNKTGLSYLGKTTKDPLKYLGSGIDWKAHIKEHGKDVSTEIIKECSTKEEVNHWGRYYSELWNIVESEHWANRIPETGGGSADHFRGKKHSASTISKMKEARAKQIITEEHRAALSKSHLGQEPWNKGKTGLQTHSYETREKIRAASLGRKNPPKTLAQRQRISETQRGRKQSTETRLKKSIATKGIRKTIIQCPHCGAEGGNSQMKRWHFDNCKNK